jgi:hypothetical protein
MTALRADFGFQQGIKQVIALTEMGLNAIRAATILGGL